MAHFQRKFFEQAFMVRFDLSVFGRVLTKKGRISGESNSSCPMHIETVIPKRYQIDYTASCRCV